MNKVLLGMSGGVDSSVSALLLKNEGYEVIGATMVLFDTNNTNVSIEDAKKVCNFLKIEHHVIDLKEDFKKHVIDNFIYCYRNGLTPNPCVECNRFLKFGALYEKAKELGCDYIATGHYAKVIDNKLYKADSIEKDQTYFLYKIKKDILSHVIFPLSKYTNKDEIRQIAYDNNLCVAKKKDSQEICFIPNDDYVSYLNNNMVEKSVPGEFILKDGTKLGKHKGIIYYTIGQRKGLGISYKNPLYVLDINKSNNTIILGDEKDLYSTTLIADNINILVDTLPTKVNARVRYRSKEAKASLEILSDNKVKVIFDEPQKSITLGQSVVFYDNDQCLGGGIIIEKL